MTEDSVSRFHYECNVCDRPWTSNRLIWFENELEDGLVSNHACPDCCERVAEWYTLVPGTRIPINESWLWKYDKEADNLARPILCDELTRWVRTVRKEAGL